MSELNSVNESARKIGVSRATVYREIKDKKLRVTKVRGSTFITDAEIERYLAASERRR